MDVGGTLGQPRELSGHARRRRGDGRVARAAIPGGDAHRRSTPHLARGVRGTREGVIGVGPRGGAPMTWLAQVGHVTAYEMRRARWYLVAWGVLLLTAT